MNRLNQAVAEFLACKVIAIAGVSRTQSSLPANLIFHKLKDAGYTVFPINPNADKVGGFPCYPSLTVVPEKPEGVVIATHPKITPQIVDECIGLGIQRVWMHRSFGTGSVSQEAVQACNDHGITLISGACPMMYSKPVDPGHLCMRLILKVTGGLPQVKGSQN